MASILDNAQWHLIPDFLAVEVMCAFVMLMVRFGKGKRQFNDEEKTLFQDMKKTNGMRYKMRLYGKFLSFGVLCYTSIFWDNSNEKEGLMPGFYDMIALSVFFGIMALIDEVFDTIK